MGHNRDTVFLKALGKNLRRLRLERNLSQEALSLQCMIPQSQIGRIERGERDPSANTIRVLAEGLGEEPKILFDFKYRSKRKSKPL